MTKSEPPSNSTTTSKVQHVLLVKQRDATPSEHANAIRAPPTITSQAPTGEENDVTTCHIPVSPDTEVPIFTKFSIARQVTPPHIAQGKGHTYTLDKYLLL